jgi:putative ABC transport system substrate-binding protein
MKRREFITFVGCVAAWPSIAQPADKFTKIGFLGMAPASGYASRLAALRSGLEELGYAEGRNLVIEFRWAETDKQLPELAAALVKHELAVIVASGNNATRAAKAASSTVPIVFAGADDPRPRGNITGLSVISGALGPKRLELARELVPNATVIALLRNPNNPAKENVRSDQEIARTIGQRILVLDAANVHEIDQALAALVPQQTGALLVNADALFTAERERIVALSARQRLPTIYAWREFVESGGLMSYGTNLSSAYHQIGAYVGRILKGEKPADLPVMQPIKFELVLNMKTAKALGLTIPQSILLRADEIID